MLMDMGPVGCLYFLIVVMLTNTFDNAGTGRRCIATLPSRPRAGWCVVRRLSCMHSAAAAIRKVEMELRPRGRPLPEQLPVQSGVAATQVPAVEAWAGWARCPC